MGETGDDDYTGIDCWIGELTVLRAMLIVRQLFYNIPDTTGGLVSLSTKRAFEGTC